MFASLVMKLKSVISTSINITLETTRSVILFFLCGPLNTEKKIYPWQTNAAPHTLTQPKHITTGLYVQSMFYDV